MPFGMGPAGWSYVTPYGYPYARFPYMPRFWWGGRRGWGRGGWGRGFGWCFFAPYWYPWW